VGFLEKWANSAAHLRLFSLVTRLGLLIWAPLPAALAFFPASYWASRNGLSQLQFGLLIAVLAIPVVWLMVTSYRRGFVQSNRMLLQVEFWPGLLGLHIGKQLPKRRELLACTIQSVLLARALGAKAVRVESPLFVKGTRLSWLVASVQTALIAQGHTGVTLKVVGPKPMFWPRSVCFSALRWLRRYDVKGTHLPPFSLFSTPTAGILLVLQ
jgi:hypothetical protein